MNSSIKNIRKFLAHNSNLSSDQTEALRTLINSYDECSAELAKLSEKELRAEYNRITSKFNSKPTDLNDVQLDDGVEIENRLNYLGALKEKRLEIYYTLRGFGYSLNRNKRKDIVKDLNRESWRVKHEILTRWSWISSQHKQKQKGHNFNRLYLCEVGPKIHRKTLDREYHIFLRFLPHYCQAVGLEYLLYDKPEPPAPDFLLINDSGNYLSLEVTEAPLNEKYGFEEKRRELLNQRLYEDFGNRDVSLTVIGRPKWSELYNQYGSIKKWLESVLENLTFPEKKRHLSFQNREIGFTIWVYKSSDGFQVFDMSADGSGLPYVGNSIEVMVNNAVSKSLRKKETKKYQTQYPCLLILYNNTGLFDVDYAAVKEMVDAAHLNASSHFSEIWLTDDSSAIRIRGKLT